MIHHRFRLLLALVVLCALLGAVVHSVRAQPLPGGPASPQAVREHGEHGTPEGWKFTWPKGDPGEGRAVFAKLKCYSCHEVKGEAFPAPGDKEKVGPELSAMGPLHNTEYFVEAIVNPSATIEKGKGYEAADGSSKMPSFNDSMTVQEVADLVAFLRSLKPPSETPAVTASTEGGLPMFSVVLTYVESRAS